MRPISNHRALLITALVGLAAHFCAGQTQAQQKTVSIFIVRHAEVDASQPTIPLSPVGRQRAELLAPTVDGVTFTHLLATHTTRARQMLEAIAAKQGLQIVQLPDAWLSFRWRTRDRPNLKKGTHRTRSCSIAKPSVRKRCPRSVE